MRIEIEIPKEYEGDYNKDKFDEFFGRVLCDIADGTMCGRYEKETAQMLLHAFAESKPAYDVEKVVELLESWTMEADIIMPFDNKVLKGRKMIASENAIGIVKEGGKE